LSIKCTHVKDNGISIERVIEAQCLIGAVHVPALDAFCLFSWKYFTPEAAY
jgi:hypothetical protein